jgi:hypothetical protein
MASPNAQGSQTGLKIRCSLEQVQSGKGLAGRLIGVEDPPLHVENHDPFTEAVQQGLGEG